ncbi:MFS transporter [Streptomyces sp. VTCC 41912]|uniref:MFS transporter n=1 Tax=Streptomyces TaxID=1883 RepID=UPI001F1AAD42|nr:MFS transporter [Streptomyces noursei]MCE4944840.1 MFS transporter [Streptomyces noursei]
MAPPTLLDRIGIPKALVFGYLGVLLFMVGDGVESGFIAPFMADHGAGTEVRASYVITAYGVTVMLASWLSGALSDLWGPRRVMQLGLAVWIVFDVLYLTLALGPQNYPLMLLFYGLRGFGYPLFAFGFLVWITATAPAARMGTAVGWFYVAFTGGLPTLGSLVAGATNPWFGAMGTLWIALGIIALGGVCCLLGVRERTGFARLAPPGVNPVQSLLSSLSIAWTHPKVAVGCVVRIINTAPEFGFLVFLPTFFGKELGFGEGRWLTLLAVIYGTNVFCNLLFGVIGDKIGWRRTIATFGGLGCAVTTLALYFVPLAVGPHYGVALGVGMLYGVTLAGFVPISALVPALAPENKGGAMALLNLGAGGAAFVGPAIVSVFLDPLGPAGVVLIFAGLYVVAAVLTLYLKPAEVRGPEAPEAASPVAVARS